jgi:hypothetical protein
MMRKRVESQFLRSRFCYLPAGQEPPAPGPSVSQRSRSVAFDPDEQRIYVQPQTFSDDGKLLDSKLGVFSEGRSTALEWHPLEDGRNAGGMAVEARTSVLLGQGAILSRYDAQARAFGMRRDLSEHGIAVIEGLALDRSKKTLLVLDGARGEIVELRLSALE